jgi:hypothetical protein
VQAAADENTSPEYTLAKHFVVTAWKNGKAEKDKEKSF